MVRKFLAGFTLLAALAVVALAAVWSGPVQEAQAQGSPALAATVNDDRSVTLTLSDGPGNWWFKISEGACLRASGTTADAGRGYDPQFAPYPVRAYSDGRCSGQIAETSFTIESSTITATVNDDNSVDLAMTNPPRNWWFKINRGSCTPASGTEVNGISGYGPGTYRVYTYTDSRCFARLVMTEFTIPSDNLTATLNDNLSVNLTLRGGGTSAEWWFRINNGSCTRVSGNALNGISGYRPGTHHVRAYSDAGCRNLLGVTDFTIPTPTLTATRNQDRSVNLNLSGVSDGLNNWWFRINNGSCTRVSGTEVNGISGYRSGTYSVNAYSNSGCNYWIGSASFTIPTVNLTATVNRNRSVDLDLSHGPDNWWFRINWGSCTPVSGTEVNGISGYRSGAYSVKAYSNSGCNYQMDATSFTIP